MTNHFVHDDGRVEERITGYRVACQDCPHIYAISARGAFKPHRLSRPFTPELEDAPPSGQQQAQPSPREPIPSSQPLKGRERPRV